MFLILYASSNISMKITILKPVPFSTESNESIVVSHQQKSLFHLELKKESTLQASEFKFRHLSRSPTQKVTYKKLKCMRTLVVISIVLLKTSRENFSPDPKTSSKSPAGISFGLVSANLQPGVKRSHLDTVRKRSSLSVFFPFCLFSFWKKRRKKKKKRMDKKLTAAGSVHQLNEKKRKFHHCCY